MSRYFILENGEPVPAADMMTWALWFEEASLSMTRHIGDDTIGAARVSTVFLGMNHSWSESEPPLIFAARSRKPNCEPFACFALLSCPE